MRAEKTLVLLVDMVVYFRIHVMKLFYCHTVKNAMVNIQKPVWGIIVQYSVWNDHAVKHHYYIFEKIAKST